MKCGVAILALALVVPLVAVPARAHPTDGRHIEATTTPVGVDMRVTAEVARAAVAAGLDLEPNREALEARAAVVAAWLSRGIELSSSGGACRAEHGSVDLVDTVNGPAVAHSMSWTCASLDGLELSDRELTSAPPAAQTIVTIDGAAHVLRPGAESVTVERPDWWSTARSFGVEGMVHLLTGYDHLLFVFTLLLAAGVRSRDHGLRRALVEAARIVTAFTLGHSITLALAALDVVVAPSALVEAAIAASIVVAAALNLSRPEVRAARPWLALAFGLVHGFGFSSVLAEIGLPAGQRVVALLSFNVGIELAQLAFVAVVLGPLAWLARRRFYERAVLVPGSLVIAAIAAVWLVERAAGA